MQRAAYAHRPPLYEADRAITDDEHTLHATADWMTDTITRLRDVVVPIVREAADEIDKADRERAAEASAESDDETDLDDEE